MTRKRNENLLAKWFQDVFSAHDKSDANLYVIDSR